MNKILASDLLVELIHSIESVPFYGQYKVNVLDDAILRRSIEVTQQQVLKNFQNRFQQLNIR